MSLKRSYSVVSCTHRIDFFNENVVGSLSPASQLEIIAIENEGNRYSVPQALNIGLNRAKGDVLIFCHHDIQFPPDWLQTLETRIDELDGRDPAWGVIGVMGVSPIGRHAGSIDDPCSNRSMGKLPSLVQSLDEVCLIFKADSGLRFDESLGGYHLYGADLCLQASKQGRKCYAIDAPFKHLSAGTMDREFYSIGRKLAQKWANWPGSPLVIETTCGVFALRAQLFVRFLAAAKIVRRRLLWKMGSLADIKNL